MINQRKFGKTISSDNSDGFVQVKVDKAIQFNFIDSSDNDTRKQ